jgi:hypothetical protein
MAHDPIHTLFLVPGAGPNPGIPGNYLHGSAAGTNLVETTKHTKRWVGFLAIAFDESHGTVIETSHDSISKMLFRVFRVFRGE